jgi:uncharacterized membrane protein YcaP (DUF421 family)
MPEEHRNVFNLSVTPAEFAIRAIVVYLVLLLFMRIGGKRQAGQLAPFDLVLLLIISNAVQNSMNAGDNSLLGGLISATVLVVVHYLVSLLTTRSRHVERVLDGQPELLIRNGEVFGKTLSRAQITHHELHSALRQNGCTSVDQVALAILEINGAISVIKREAGQNVTSPSVPL